ncbi:MAG: LamG-like jellyroll fold domain-containing protein, partial [Candidatus Spechtbacterales bacterium]|nr:LamG-like jellyroll fold domain-containing protein [Candidatus Spechtbacterales bacterium]
MKKKTIISLVVSILALTTVITTSLLTWPNEAEAASPKESYLTFDGTNDRVVLPNLDISGSALTIEAWVKSDNFANCATYNDCRIISKATSTSEQDHYWMISTIKQSGETRIRFRLKTNGTTSTLIASSGPLSTNTWTHVAATYDGSQMKLYKDGTLIGSASKTGTLSTNNTVPVWIGANPDSSNFWKGQVDDVRIWNTARTQTQIQNSMSSELSSQSGLFAYYKFNEGTGQTIGDSSGNSRNGTLGSTSSSDTSDPTWASTAPDNTAPTISNINASGITGSSATITWTTSEQADSQVEFGTTTSLGTNTPLVTTMQTSHTINLSSLTADTTYYYTVKSKDAAGNLAVSSQNMFTTTSASTPTPTPQSWQDAWDSRDQAKIDAWYAANTGYQALGYQESDLWSVPTNGHPSYNKTFITQSWLETHEGNGHVSFDPVSGRWLIEAVKFDHIGFTLDGVSNVTVRGFYIKNPTFSDTEWGGYAVNAANGGGVNSIIEYGTIDGTNNAAVGFTLSAGDGETNVVIVRNVNIFNFGAGFHAYSGATYEYNWFHDLYYFCNKHGSPSGCSHNTSGSIRGSNTIIRRNHAEDGNSSAISLYANDPIDNVLVEENILNTANAYYCFNFARGKTYADSTTRTRMINNIYGKKYHPNCAMAAPITGSDLFTTYSGNTMIDEVAPAQDTTPPTLSNIQATNITTSGATITWTTSEQADSQVEFGTTTSLGTNTPLVTTMQTSHTINLSNLTENTTYYYTVKSKDAAGNLAVSSQKTFTTSTSGSNSWEEAWATQNVSVIKQWYNENAGIAGAGLTEGDLTPSGSVTTTHDGQIIEGLLVSGSIQVVHSNVIVKNTKVVSDGSWYAIYVPFTHSSEVTNLTIENVSIEGFGCAEGSDPGCLRAIQAYGSGLKATRVHIRGHAGGISLRDGTQVSYSFIDDIQTWLGSHNTGMSSHGGTNIEVMRNYVAGSTSSAISLYSHAPISDVLISENLLDEGTYALIGGANKTYGDQIHNVVIRDNLIDRTGNPDEPKHVLRIIHSWCSTCPGNIFENNTVLDGSTEPDNTPPTISNINASGITGSSATITWTTNEQADSQVEFGTTTSLGTNTPLVTTMQTSHTINLSNLTENTTYYYKVKSKDSAGNLAVSSQKTFTTTSTSGSNSWEEAWATQNVSVIKQWYNENAGIAGAGLTEGDLTPSGSVTTTHDG